MDRMQGLGHCLNPQSDQPSSSESRIQSIETRHGPLQRAQRPGYSTSMKYQIKVVTNFYRLGFNKECFYHYDIDIAPYDKQKKTFSLDERIPGKDRCRQIMFEAIKRQKQLEDYRPVYDGQKNLFTCQPLPISREGHSFEVPIEIRGRNVRFLLRIKPVKKKNGEKDNIISLRSLERYIRKETTVAPSEIQMVLETILSYRPYDSKYVRVVNSLFPPNPRTKPLGDGIDVWFGFNQSVRFTEDGASLVINTAAIAFHRSGPVVEKVKEMFRGVPENMLNDRQVNRLDKALKSIRVHVTHQPFKRKYRIKGVSNPARFQKVEISGKCMSVEDYFWVRYKRKLRYPNLPCLQMESGRGKVFIPMEVCEFVSGQRVKNLDKDKAAKMIKATAIPPSEKFPQIQKYAKAAAENNAAHSSGYGMEIDLEPTAVTARVLHEPTIGYSNNICRKPNELGVWNNDSHFARPVFNSKRWRLISFADRQSFDLEKLKHLASSLNENLKKCGLDPRLVDIKIYNSEVNTESTFEKAMELQCDFLVFVISAKDFRHPYAEIKFLGDIKYGLPTQCINGDKNNFSHSKLNNMCLKINTKLGGVNHFLSEWPIALEKEGVIVLGADVVHNVAVGCPSVAAVVGSIDFTLSNYASSCRPQSNPKGSGRSQEIIIDLKEMFVSVLKNYYRNTKKRKPQKILFYRDGVSEGQYDHVLRHEIPLIKDACRSLDSNYQPPITFVVVQKRHNVRIRPEKEEEGVGHSKNVPPGTTIDTDIVDPVNHDFFLCSHEGIQGTSKPAHYTVLYDENGVKPNTIQELSYYLCHVCARCNRSISIPTPVKYADLLAYQASLYVKFMLQSTNRRINPGDKIPEDIIQMLKSIETRKTCRLFFI